MQGAFANCAELLRAADHDRFITSLFAPAGVRRALQALYAFNAELARVRDAAHTALPGEVRLQWWSDVVNGERAGEAATNPVASALLATIERHRLPAAKLAKLIEARRFDLYDDPMASVADLESYARNTSSGLIALAAHILGKANVESAAEPAGIAYAMAALLRAFPVHAARRQLYVPLDILERHEVRPQDVYAGRSSPGVESALAEMRTHARRHLAEAGPPISALSEQVTPAFLLVPLVGPTLDRLDRDPPFTPAEIPAWRRQWLIWRAARDRRRIAG